MKCPHCGERISRFSSIRPKRAKQTYTRGDHEYLSGVLAHTRRRLEIFRNAGGEATWFDDKDPGTVEEIHPATCQGCTEAHPIYWNTFHWHHNVRSLGGKRCDCAGCALAVCEPWHTRYHNRVISFRQVEK